MKYIDATKNRPEGERELNNEWVKIEIAKFTAELEREEWRKNDRKSITVFKNDHITIVLIMLAEDALFPPHDAAGTIVVQALKGNIDLDIEGNIMPLEAGNIITINKGIRYSGIARKNTLALLTQFHIG